MTKCNSHVKSGYNNINGKELPAADKQDLNPACTGVSQAGQLQIKV
jgi:hypothetical protein